MPRNNLYEQVQVHYRNTGPDGALLLTANGQELAPAVLPAATRLGVARWQTAGELDKLRFSFEGDRSTLFFGYSLDCASGVAVDNVAFRGSSGMEFTSIHRKYLAQQLKQLNTKLLILQFGVNVAPYVRQNYQYYQNRMYEQLSFLKSLDPELDILVVSVSDMARKQGPYISSYPNLPTLRDAQMAAALKAGCAFYDLYTGMGGANSIQSWVKARPQLAQTDYTHFTRRGARLVGEMIYNELMSSYEQWQQEQVSVQ
jgi:lysophospholipase L1-like esterase